MRQCFHLVQAKYTFVVFSVLVHKIAKRQWIRHAIADLRPVVALLRQLVSWNDEKASYVCECPIRRKKRYSIMMIATSYTWLMHCVIVKCSKHASGNIMPWGYGTYWPMCESSCMKWSWAYLRVLPPQVTPAHHTTNSRSGHHLRHCVACLVGSSAFQFHHKIYTMMHTVSTALTQNCSFL